MNAATGVALSKALTVWATRTEGVDADTLHDAVLSVLALGISEYPIGGIKKPPSTQGYLYASWIEGTAKSADPSIFAVLTASAADLAINMGQVATLTATVTVRIVEAPVSGGLRFRDAFRAILPIWVTDRNPRRSPVR